MTKDVRALRALPGALDSEDQLPALRTNLEDKVVHEFLESHGQNFKRVRAKIVDSFFCETLEAYRACFAPSCLYDFGLGRNIQCDRIGCCAPAPVLFSITTTFCAWPAFFDQFA